MIEQRNDNLTKDEELELGRKIQEMKKVQSQVDAGKDKLTKSQRKTIIEGEEAVEILTGNYINLARNIAHKHHKRTGTRYEIEDLLQDAIGALVKAAYAYDPSKNCRLSTYAFYGITKKVSSTINFQRLVRMPENKMGEYIQITKAQKEYNDLSEEEQKEYDNELDYVYKNVDLKNTEINLILENMQPQVSLNAHIYDGDGELMDIIVDEDAEDEVIWYGNVHEGIAKVVNKLSQYERDLIAYEYGVFPASMPFTEFLEKYDLAERRVRFETNKVKRKMRRIAEEIEEYN